MTLITLDSGTIQGFTDGQIETFLGIPYAAPIVNGTRFESAQPVPRWEGTRDATRLGAICPQVPTYGPVGRGATSTHAAGEDFLTVNIRSADLSGKAPVLVWVHGGGYAVGSGNEPILQTGAFARSGIVEVTLNYRLGALGFLSIKGRPENRGLTDIIAALDWVQRHIARFGGDPERVTLAGRSAGGFAVATLMAMPAAAGLFARAFVQSGATPAVLTTQDAARTTNRMLDRLGVTTEELESLPLDRLMEAQREICDQSYDRHDFARDGAVTLVGIPFQPVLDPATLPLHPEQAAVRGPTARVPVLIGTTSAEYLTHSTVHGQLTTTDVARLIDPRVRPLGLTGEMIVARYKAALPEHDGLGLWRAIAGDLVFQNPTTRYARALSLHQPVFKYLYGQLDRNETGAAHGAEVGLVWWNAATDRETLPERYRTVEPELGNRVHETWRCFIAGEPLSISDGMHWPEYRPDHGEIGWITPADTTLIPDPFIGRLPLWASRA